MILFLLTPVAQHSQHAIVSRTIGDYDAAFAVGVQVPAGVKTETGELANAPDLAAAVHGAVSLACIFNDDELALAGDFQNGVHVGRLTIKMNGKYDFGFASDHTLDLFDIEVE